MEQTSCVGVLCANCSAGTRVRGLLTPESGSESDAGDPTVGTALPGWKFGSSDLDRRGHRGGRTADGATECARRRGPMDESDNSVILARVRFAGTYPQRQGSRTRTSAGPREV